MYSLESIFRSENITKEKIDSTIKKIVEYINSFGFSEKIPNKIQVKNIFFTEEGDTIVCEELTTDKHRKFFPERSLILDTDFIPVSPFILFLELCSEINEQFGIYIYYRSPSEGESLSSQFIDTSKIITYLKYDEVTNIISTKKIEKTMCCSFSSMPATTESGEMITRHPSSTEREYTILQCSHFYPPKDWVDLLPDNIKIQMEEHFDKVYSSIYKSRNGNVMEKSRYTSVVYLPFFLSSRPSYRRKDVGEEKIVIDIRSSSNEVYTPVKLLSGESEQPILLLVDKNEKEWIGKVCTNTNFLHPSVGVWKILSEFGDVIRKKLALSRTPILLDNYIFVGGINTGIHVSISERLYPIPSPLPEEEIKKMSKDILLDIKRLHSLGWAHFDIKPDNIMRNENGEYLVIDYDDITNFKQNEYRNTYTPNFASVNEGLLYSTEIGIDISPIFDLIEFGYTLNGVTSSSPRKRNEKYQKVNDYLFFLTSLPLDTQYYVKNLDWIFDKVVSILTGD